MDEKELKENLKKLEQQGWKPELCDTPVPYYDNPVMCGNPNDVGDITEEYRMLPKDFLSMQPEFMVTVKGDSMKDADILEGDVVKVTTNTSVYDGDIVLAKIDNEYTLKAFCEDEDGRAWLLPQNDAYNGILLSDQQSVWIIGVVTSIIKQAPRINFRVCKDIIRRTKQKMRVRKEYSQLQISAAIRTIAPTIKVARRWYAVYRAFADLNIVEEDDFTTFCDMITAEVPKHEHLPTVVELQRMATLSFSKPVAAWKISNAPVKGKVFNDYMKLAKWTKELMEE